jgi:hypothetical protein
MEAKRNPSRHDWTPGREYRIVCDCQRHARNGRSLWRRTLRIASRGLAVLVGVPLAFSAIGFPTETMNLNVPMVTDTMRATFGTRAAVATPAAGAKSLPIVTAAGRDNYLSARVQQLSLEAVKEQFFTTRIPYGSIIYREARRNNLPPELVAAIVESESDFRPRLTSHKNAQGLMQIMPSTGRLLGADDLFDPEVNIAAGTKYLRYLLNRFEDPSIALAAYNAGEGNVAKFGGVPPFEETQNYIQRVHARSSSYRQRVQTTYLASARMQRRVAVD